MSWYKHSNGAGVEEDGQGYLVSVSDMMSGLLFIFIITLMIFAIDFNRERVRAENLQDELTDAKRVRSKLLHDLEQSLKEAGVTVRIDTERGLLHVPENILFVSGKAEFQPGGRKSLAILAEHLALKLPCYSGTRSSSRPQECTDEEFKPGRLEAVFIEGHTDNVPIRSKQFEDNWELSAKRSIVTYRHFLATTPELGKLLNASDEPLFGVSGYAETRPEVYHAVATPEAIN